IHFNIPGVGVHTIVLAAPPVPLSMPVRIDGYTQPGASPNTLVEGDNAVILVELDANGFDTPAAEADGCTIRGLAIFKCGGPGAVVLIGKQNVVVGNFIGLRADGTTVGNLDAGVAIVS